MEGKALDYLEIEGGSPLCGEVRIQGSKNAALPILSAALLNPGITVLKNCPDISDVSAMLEILEGYGCVTGREKGILFLDASELRPGQAKKECAGKMRSSIMLLGSLLGRLGEVYLPYPGGCVIGRRPIDLHLWALRQMGAEVWEEEEGLRAVCAKPKAAELRLPFPSVGATENILLLAACAEGATVLHNAAREPEITELCRFLRSMGAKITGAGTGTITVTGKRRLHDTEFSVMPDRIVAGTYMLLAACAGGKIRIENPPAGHGSLLGRLGEVYLPYPGGCVIGRRPIDLHLWALRQMGAEVWEEEEGLRAVCAKPKAAELRLPFPSVGATENILLLAACAEGATVLHNAAREPEITELCRFLRSMGAKITGAGTGTITVTGKRRLHDTEFSVMPDRIVAGTYMLLAACAGGKIRIENPPAGQLGIVKNVLGRMGVRCESFSDSLFLWSPARTKGGVRVTTQPYPGFPTDLQSPLMAALCFSEGESVIEETIFEARFKIAEELMRMGADVSVEGRRAVIRGKRCLEGADLTARELRGGAALCIAAAAAEGRSRISQYQYIARGYENIIRDLQDLGVVIHCI